MEEIQGRVWKFGDDLDTDCIVSGQYLDLPIEEVVKHVLESMRPNFAVEVNSGDIIVAGKNFGCGSSREQAPSALKGLGIGCVVAESFGRIFFRNAIAIGLPVLTCARVTEVFEDGQQALVSMKGSRIENVNTGARLQGDPLSVEMQYILDKGGIVQYLRNELGCRMEDL